MVEASTRMNNDRTSLGQPELTMVCCIEPGRLEIQTLLMAESLRTFGGRLANVPVIAVIGRPGPPLPTRTVRRLAQLGVTIVKAPTEANRAKWFGYSNKVVAVGMAQSMANTPTIAWVDSDVLFADEPAGLILNPSKDFTGRVEPFHASVTVTNRLYEPYWRALAKVVGAKFDELPWRKTGREQRLLFFNSGVFSWRRDSDFAGAYVDAFWKVLDSRIAQPDGSFFAADQLIISPVLAAERLRWRYLDHRYHHIAFPQSIDDEEDTMVGAAVLHYSGSLDAPFRPVFLSRLEREQPRLFEWLGSRIDDCPGSAWRTAWATALKVVRRAQWKDYERNVRRCV